MRISDWSSDVCSSDLDGKYVMTKGFVENEPGSSITQVTFGKRLSQLLTAGQEYSWGVRMFTGQSKPGDALDPDDYVAHASTSFKVAPVSLVAAPGAPFNGVTVLPHGMELGLSTADANFSPPRAAAPPPSYTRP